MLENAIMELYCFKETNVINHRQRTNKDRMKKRIYSLFKSMKWLFLSFAGFHGQVFNNVNNGFKN